MRRLLLVAGLACVAAAAVGLALLLDREPAPPEGAPPAPPRAAPPTPPIPPQEAPPEAPPGELPVIDPPWPGAGAFVWNETDVSPEQLAATMREHGFGWVAFRLHDGATQDAVEGD